MRMLHSELFPFPKTAPTTVFSTKAIKGQKHENACSKSHSGSREEGNGKAYCLIPAEY